MRFVSGPVGDAAPAQHPFLHFVTPDFLPTGPVHSGDIALECEIHNAVYDNGYRLISGRMGPDLYQLVDVVPVNLLQGRVAVPPQNTIKILPVSGNVISMDL